MPASKLGLGVAAQVNKNNLDGDALQFCSRSGASQVVELTQFARGVKTLNLWNSLVSWPLLPGQNAGTGTTAYSFGGLGTRDLTLNLATWTLNGVQCNASQQMLSGSHSFNLPLTIMGVHRWDGGQTVFWDGSSPNQMAYYHTTPTGVLKGTATGSGGVEIIGPAYIPTGAPEQHFFGMFVSSNRLALYSNGMTPTVSSISPGAQTSFGPRVVLGNNNGGIFSTGRQNTTVFACIVTGLSGSYEQVRTLYKNTIGRNVNVL